MLILVFVDLGVVGADGALLTARVDFTALLKAAIRSLYLDSRLPASCDTPMNASIRLEDRCLT